MIALKGVIKDGQVVLPQRADLPDGTEVDIVPVGRAGADNGAPPDPDETARLLALMDQVRPWMTPEEEEVWKQRRAEDKAAELAQWEAEQKT